MSHYTDQQGCDAGMIGVRAGVGTDAVRFDAGHVLFVEGGGDDAISESF